jgi:hypothetical protein
MTCSRSPGKLEAELDLIPNLPCPEMWVLSPPPISFQAQAALPDTLWPVQISDVSTW